MPEFIVVNKVACFMGHSVHVFAPQPTNTNYLCSHFNIHNRQHYLKKITVRILYFIESYQSGQSQH